MLLGFVFLFFCNGTIAGYIAGIIVCILAYFLEIVIDNCFARMKWQVALKSSWVVAVVLGVINVGALMILL